MKLRRIGMAAVVALAFAEGDSASDSDSGGSDSGDSGNSADSGLSVTHAATVSSSDDRSDSDSGGSDSSNRRSPRPPGQPGATGGLPVEDLRDIPFRGDDSPIKK